MAVAKDGNVFSVTLPDGSLPVAGGHPLGVYQDDCRHLSGHELTLAGRRPVLLVTTEPGPGVRVHEMTNPEIELPDGRRLAVQTLRLRVERRLDAAGAVHERVVVQSYAREKLQTHLVLRLAADFAPMLAVRGLVTGPPGAATIERVRNGLRLSARGRDGVVRATTVTATPAPEAGDGADLRFPVSLAPGEEAVISLRYELLQDGRAPSSPVELPEPAAVSLGDALAQRVLDRALLDLRELRSRLDGWHYFSAGVPWYATLFGRDSLITALQVVAWQPAVAGETLRLLAGRLGRQSDALHEEEPGKVLHELRTGEAATPGLTPLARYYGTVDATPLWLCLLCEHADWTGDLTLFRELRPQVDAMLGWIDGPGDGDGDGLVDYAARAPGGLRNQGWKDSDDGICDEQGRPLEPPIALVEAQGYVVRAKAGLARLLALDGDAAAAARLAREADELAGRLERFWLPDRRCYAMALDRDGRASRALASNQGHLLWARAVPAERAQAIRDALTAPAMSTGWGVRTFGAGQPGYNPVGYHLGTVWPHDTALIAAGLRDFGFAEDFTKLFENLLDAASHSPAYRLPELFAGFSREESPAPVPYPVACRPQAWAAGALPQLTAVGLGLVADGLAGRLRIRRPWLPSSLRRVQVRGLAIAGSTVDLVYERTAGGELVVADVHVDGDVAVDVDGG